MKEKAPEYFICESYYPLTNNPREMKEYKEKDLVSLLKTGNFTIIYWDNEGPTFYKGKWDKDKEYDKDEYATMEKSRIEIELYGMNGYLPDEVRLLVMALKGQSDSI